MSTITARRRLFEGVESSMWTLSEPPTDRPGTDQIKPSTMIETALRILLADSYPKPLTVFEITVDLLKYWRPIPTSPVDQHSTVYQFLETFKPKFVEVNPRPRAK